MAAGELFVVIAHMHDYLENLRFKNCESGEIHCGQRLPELSIGLRVLRRKFNLFSGALTLCFQSLSSLTFFNLSGGGDGG